MMALQRVNFRSASPGFGPASGNTSISIQVCAGSYSEPGGLFHAKPCYGCIALHLRMKRCPCRLFRVLPSDLAGASGSAQHMERLASIVHTFGHALPLLLQGAGLQDGVQCVFLNGTAQPLQRLSYNVTVLNSGELLPPIAVAGSRQGRPAAREMTCVRSVVGTPALQTTPQRGVRSLCAQPVQARRHARRRGGS